MKHSHSNSNFEKSLRPGWFIHWQGQTYRIISYDKSDPLQIPVENIVTSEADVLNVLQLLSVGEDKSEPIFAPTYENLQTKVERQCLPLKSVTVNGLPDNLLTQADNCLLS